MWLPRDVTQAVDAKNIEVFYLNRQQAKIWNDSRGPSDLRIFSGYYWFERGKPSQDHGPFFSRSAAYKNAFEVLALRRAAAPPKPQVVRGSGIVQAPVSARTSYASKAADRRARAEERRADREAQARREAESQVIRLADRRPTRAQQRQIDPSLRRKLKRQGLL